MEVAMVVGGYFRIKVWADTAKLTNIVIAGFADR